MGDIFIGQDSSGLARLVYAASLKALLDKGYKEDDPEIILANKLYTMGMVIDASFILKGIYSSKLEEMLEETGIDSMVKSTKKGRCIAEAFELMEKNKNKGAVFYVVNIEGKSVGHAYYIEDLSDIDAYAKNQSDNGYEGYPKLKVSEVLAYGMELKDKSGKELTGLLRERALESLKRIGISPLSGEQ